MKYCSPVVLATIAAFMTAVFATAALTQTTKKSAPVPNQPATTATKPTTIAYQDKGFAPGFDDLMTMLVQPRHIKLYYAGSAKNWELAAAEARDLRSSFDRIAQTIPNYEGNDVSLSIRDFITPKLNTVDAATAAGDAKKFAAAYQDLTTGCNECHTYMEHPFLVIRKPSGVDGNSAHADQDFNPRP